MIDWRLVKHHDENTTSQVGILDFGQSRNAPSDGRLLWLRGDGPLTVPPAVLSTDNIEVTETEGLLLANLAAIRLLERAMAGAPSSSRNTYAARLSRLQGMAADLADGAGQTRSVASYSLGW